MAGPQLLFDTASINDQIKNVIDLYTEPWGTQVTTVEIKDITLPENMQRAMAKCTRPRRSDDEALLSHALRIEQRRNRQSIFVLWT
jgi:regulator of protease activity HflC (stomatin/prohibitin superfamily)